MVNIVHDYEEAVRTLARWHGEGENEPIVIFSVDDPEGGVVRLLEVSDAFPATGEAWPIGFGPSREFPFPSEVIVVTGAEYQAIERGEMPLPERWAGLTRRQVWPS